MYFLAINVHHWGQAGNLAPVMYAVPSIMDGELLPYQAVIQPVRMLSMLQR